MLSGHPLAALTVKAGWKGNAGLDRSAALYELRARSRWLFGVVPVERTKGTS